MRTVTILVHESHEVFDLRLGDVRAEAEQASAKLIR
jgi:hypothetical protein